MRQAQSIGVFAFMKSRLLLFYSAGVLAFSIFAINGVADAPLWTVKSVRPLQPTAFDRARHELSLAEDALRSTVSTTGGVSAAAYAENALTRANESLTRRPINPHAWHARALANEALGRGEIALSDYRTSVLSGPFEQTLAISRIDFALRNWASLSAEERDDARAQLTWIWPRRRADVRELARRSATHAAVIRSTLSAPNH